jgi:hypothetical protein
MLETFHALMIKITYTPHIRADFHIGSSARICHPSTHQSNKAPIEVTLSNCLKQKDVGYEKEKKRRIKKERIKACSKACSDIYKSKKRKEKDSPHPKFQKQKRESYTKRSSHTITTHSHILIRLYNLFLLGSCL